MLRRLMMAGGGGGGDEYRYWRLYNLLPQSGTWVALQEIELRASVGGADLTSPALAVARAFESGHYDVTSCDKAFDNNLNDFIYNAWVTGAGQAQPHFIGWDFLVPTVVKEVALLQQAYAGGSQRGPKSFVVQGSNNNATWDDVATFAGIAGWTMGVWKTFTW